MDKLTQLPRLSFGALLVSVVAGCLACGEEPQPASWLQRVHLPAEVRSGSPLLAVGTGVRGLRLELHGAGGSISAALSSLPDRGVFPAVTSGLMAPWTHGVVSGGASPFVDGTPLIRACLLPSSLGGKAKNCLPLSGVTWRSTLPSQAPPVLVGAPTIALRHGALASISGATVPLPGEGTATLTIEVRRGQDVWRAGPVAVLPWNADGSRGASVLVAPAWLGPTLGAAEVRMRLQRSYFVGADTTSWSTWQQVDVAPPSLSPPLQDDVGRGLPVPGSTFASTWPAIWRGGPKLSLPGIALAVSGQWQTKAKTDVDAWSSATARLLPLCGQRRGRAVLTSKAWVAGGWKKHVGQTLTASLQWRLRVPTTSSLRPQSSTAPWPLAPVSGPIVSTKLHLQPTIQRVELLISASSVAGVARFGLAHAQETIFNRVAELVQSHFDQWSVEVRLNTIVPPFDEGTERVRLALLDRDPNAAGLLGNDPTVGKDEGNQLLDESLDGGVHLPGRELGQPSYGGVFLAGFFALSPTANPSGGVADPAFDVIFSPFASALGGQPLDAARLSTATKAIEVLSQVIAGTVSHEVGHTLGLAAVNGYHHSGDNPGWRMDSGTARPFAERANLPGSGGERWGPLDAAYLDQILPKDPP